MHDIYDNDFDKAFDEAVEAIEKKEHRLIWADDLKNLIYESWGGDPAYHTARYGQLKTETEAKAEYACLMLENIDAQPTIEAEPIKRGRWIKISDTMLQCSKCCEYVRGTFPLGINYCPHCGAHMMGEEEE